MGRLTDAVRRMMESLQISSASPGNINEVLQIDPSVDLDEEIRDILEGKSETGSKISLGGKNEVNEGRKEKEFENTVGKINLFEAGNVGKLQKLSSQQFGNLQGFARDPVNFVFGTITKKLGKFARFGVFAFFAILIEQMIKFALNELMQPGRPWDRRFKRLIQDEILLFTDRKEKEELRRGFREVRVTTRQGLRGGAGKVNGNLFSPFSIPSNFIRPDVVSTETNDQAAGLRKSGPTKRVF